MDGQKTREHCLELAFKHIKDESQFVKYAQDFYNFLYPEPPILIMKGPSCYLDTCHSTFPATPSISTQNNASTDGAESELLTKRQAQVLNTIIMLNKSAITATQKELAARTDIGRNNIGRFTKTLIDKGFVREVTAKNHTHINYVAVLNDKGEELNPIIRDPITGVIKCPPAYAEGFGMGTSNFESVT